jgi:DUF1009 family protein
MHDAGAAVLAIEAQKTILLDESETIARANRYKMCIVSISGSNGDDGPPAGP